MKVRVNKVNVVLQELAPFRRCNAVAEFAERLFKPGLNQVTQKLREQFGLSGEALQKKVLDELRLPAIGCFVAGTLVHTKECLKPIEQIKVGDWVLSRPENPEHGTQTDYKRVVRTMMHHDKPVIHGSFNPLPRLIQGNAYHTDRPAMNLIMTPDHPFWLQGAGWTGAALLREDPIERKLFKDGIVDLRFIDYQGEALVGGYERQILITNDPNVGWVRGSSPFRPDTWGGTYDMATGKELADAMWDKFWDYQDENENLDEWDLNLNDHIDSKYIYRATVYNIEVEGWHTYFVGELGVWVHNANCGKG